MISRRNIFMILDVLYVCIRCEMSSKNGNKRINPNNNEKSTSISSEDTQVGGGVEQANGRDRFVQ